MKLRTWEDSDIVAILVDCIESEMFNWCKVLCFWKWKYFNSFENVKYFAFENVKYFVFENIFDFF